MSNVVYLVSGTSALNKEESYKQVEARKASALRGRPRKLHHTAKEPIRSKEDYDKFCSYFLNLEHHAYRNYALFVVGIELGVLRSCDLLALTIGDVYDGKRFHDVVLGVVEKKTGKHKNVYITEKAKKALKLYLSHRDYQSLNEPLFVSQKGNALSERQARDILHKAAEAIKYDQPVAMHSLRKTWGYHSFVHHKNDNMALIDVMKAYNHSNPEVTLRYIGVYEDHYRDLCNDFAVQ